MENTLPSYPISPSFLERNSLLCRTHTYTRLAPIQTRVDIHDWFFNEQTNTFYLKLSRNIEKKSYRYERTLDKCRVCEREKREKRERKREKERLPCNVETASDTSGSEAAGSFSNRAISPDIVRARVTNACCVLSRCDLACNSQVCLYSDASLLSSKRRDATPRHATRSEPSARPTDSSSARLSRSPRDRPTADCH